MFLREIFFGFVVVFVSVILGAFTYLLLLFLHRDSSSDSDRNICHAEIAAIAAKVQECSQNERIFYVYKYIAGVSPLFACRSNISTRPILVRIEFSNTDAFNVWLHNHRPIHRIQSLPLHKDHFSFDFGLLYHDACSLRFSPMEPNVCKTRGDDVLAVEIKPKQGWDICALPESLLKLMEIETDVGNRCRFCAMQYLKVRTRDKHFSFFLNFANGHNAI